VAGLGVDAWSTRCRPAQCPSGASRSGALASLIPSVAVVQLSRRKNGTSSGQGTRQGGSGTGDSWLRTCIGPLGPNDCRGWLGRLGRCGDHFGRLPLYLSRRRLLESSLAQGRLDLTWQWHPGSGGARRHRPYLSDSLADLVADSANQPASSFNVSLRLNANCFFFQTKFQLRVFGF
jgi:hypothetical protein